MDNDKYANGTYLGAAKQGLEKQKENPLMFRYPEILSDSWTVFAASAKKYSDPRPEMIIAYFSNDYEIDFQVNLSEFPEEFQSSVKALRDLNTGRINHNNEDDYVFENLKKHGELSDILYFINDVRNQLEVVNVNDISNVGLEIVKHSAILMYGVIDHYMN